MKTSQYDSRFVAQVEAQTARKLKAKSNATQGVWFGLGLMGIIGWSVAIPTLLGVALGSWLDKHFAGVHSWTLALLIAGLAIGCFNAWHWIDQAMRDEQDDSK